MDKFIGKRLDGRYEFQELIGIGGMANVYRAFDIVEKKDVAIKILKEEYLGNEEFIRRFRNESKAVASLSHPNIVRIFDVNFGDRIQYIVMEYIDGLTLKEYIEKAQVLNWKDTVHFTVQILRALQHAHDKGIVHRDIKPQNMMLLRDGTIKVMDFGIARFARDEVRSQDKAIGSVHYISPEQAGGGITDAKSDLYSVGVMMYEMLTGQLPFDGETPEEVAVKQMQAAPILPRQIKEDIPEGLEEIIIRAMQKSPGKRYQSAAEMLRDIDEFKKNPSISFEYKYFSDEGSTKYFTAPVAVNHETGKITVGGSNGRSRTTEKKQKKKKSKAIPILLGISGGVVLVTIITILVINLLTGNNKPVDVELENFVGMKVEDVMAMDQYKDIKWETIEQPNSDYEDGVVFQQDPDAGMSVKSNSKVKLYVSTGPEMATVPSVTNMSLSDAQAKLKSAGFTNIKTVEQDNKDITANYVISTDPKGGTQVAVNTTITIYYSNGKGKQVTVPNVIGRSESDGRSALEALGLTVTVQKRSSNETAGTIIDQSATGSVDEGSTIVLYVSSGPSQQTASISIPLPRASGTYQIKVSVGGVVVSSAALDMDANPGSYTFSDTGTNEKKTYTVTVTDPNGKTSQYGTVTVDYTQTPPSQSNNLDSSVFQTSSSSPAGNTP